MEQEVVVRKTSLFKRRLRIIALVAALFAAALFLYLNANMRPAITAQAESKIRAASAKAMNDAILSAMDDDRAYAQLVEVQDNGEHVYLLQANTRNMNMLAADCAEEAQRRIAALGQQGISVPLGTITGISFLAGRGPLLYVSFTPVGSVQSAYSSEFVSAGINQTLYRVNLQLSSAVKLILPGFTETVHVSAEAAICESVLVGEVPQVYTNVANEEDMLNLIPTDLP
ncbi:MAG: sporulation protein YunB [Eubacteriales bacterium]|nr:sporulation protein YunB [Eubacteriales bacterium]